MNRRLAIVLAAFTTGLLVILGPRLLSRMEFFSVRQVELFGVQYLSPEMVVAALQIADDQNVFDDLSDIEERARRIMGIVDARVQRRLPGTLRVVISERVPIAFAMGPAGLVALDASARPLPYDPALTGLDLPIVERPDTALVGTLSTLRTVDRSLYQEIDFARFNDDGGVTLLLGGQRLALRPTPSVEDLLTVSAVTRHIAASGSSFAELDARFAGWVIVRGRGA